MCRVVPKIFWPPDGMLGVLSLGDGGKVHEKARPLDRKISAETRRLSCQGVGLGCLADATLAFGRLCRVPAFLHCGCWLMLQKNPETESVRN